MSRLCEQRKQGKFLSDRLTRRFKRHRTKLAHYFIIRRKSKPKTNKRKLQRETLRRLCESHLIFFGTKECQNIFFRTKLCKTIKVSHRYQSLSMIWTILTIWPFSRSISSASCARMGCKTWANFSTFDRTLFFLECVKTNMRHQSEQVCIQFWPHLIIPKNYSMGNSSLKQS